MDLDLREEIEDKSCKRCWYKMRNCEKGCCSTVTIYNAKRENRIKSLNKRRMAKGLPELDPKELMGIIPYFIAEFWAYYTFVN